MKLFIWLGFIFVFLGIGIFLVDNYFIYDNLISVEHKDIEVEDVSYKIANDNLSYNTKIYANKYEEEILKRDKGDNYKIIKISGTTIGSNHHYEGFMAVIYDPSKVKLAKSVGAGTTDKAYGEILSEISKKNNAIVAINSGGFYDPNWNSNGGIPHGTVIIDGKIMSDFKRGVDSGGLIGFDSNNKLVLKRMSANDAIDMGIRDAMDFGPYLIVDGKNQFKDVNYYTWACGRSAIGQRSDGIVLMLVVDGLQKHSHGASYADMASIMERYGAVNAANLDGGTSTAMTVNHEYINSPWNGVRRTIRYLPNAWIFSE